MIGKRYTCEFCKKNCQKKAIKTMMDGEFYHVECFSCKVCQRPLPLKSFYKKDGDLLCEVDYHKLYGTWCSTCGELIRESAIVAKERSYHPRCCNCSLCGRSIITGESVNTTSNCLFCSHCFDDCLREMKCYKDLLKIGSDEIFDRTLHNDSCKVLSGMASACDGFQPNLGCNETASSPIISNGSIICLSVGTSSPYNNTFNGVSSRSRSLLGMSYNKFCNFSYLERTNINSFRKGPLSSPNPKSISHFHRPGSNFSYGHVRDDILSEVKKKRDLKALSNSPCFVGPARRKDWPGPPEPAAAYPELIRGMSVNVGLKRNSKGIKMNERLARGMSALEEMVHSSGIAQAVWNDINKRCDVLDPRDASRNPSADNCLPIKLRFEYSQFASPSRFSDLKRPPSQRSACPLPSRSHLPSTLPRYFSLMPHITYGEGLTLSTSVKDSSK